KLMELGTDFVIKERKRLFKWKHSALRSAAPDGHERWLEFKSLLNFVPPTLRSASFDEPKRWSLHEEILKLFETAMELNIKQWIPRSDMIEERPSTKELGFVTIKLSRKWIAKSIHKMLKDGIDTWAPKLTVKRVWNLRAGSRLDGIRDTYTATDAKLEGWIPNDWQKTPRASYVGYRSCNTKVTEFLLEIAKRRYEAVLEGGPAKLLGYLAEEVLDCVYSTPGTRLWYDYKGLIFGQISATDKFGLRGSHFSEPDYAHVSLFNEDWRYPIRINDPGLVCTGNPSSGHLVSFSQFIEICLELYIVINKKNEGYQVGDHKEEIDLSEFWNKKSDDTALEIKFTTKMDGFACEDFGYIAAQYGDDFLYESQSETDTIFKAYMEDAKSDKVIMDGCCKFKPLLEYGFISCTIAGRDGCSLDLRVSWNFLARYL
ncbi:hypothetical protein Tco_0425761, partial [Tanacetum coccineum]